VASQCTEYSLLIGAVKLAILVILARLGEACKSSGFGGLGSGDNLRRLGQTWNVILFSVSCLFAMLDDVLSVQKSISEGVAA
jgi:hypothetical protein